MTNAIFETVSKAFDPVIKDYMKQNLIGRTLFGKTVKLPEGKYNYEYWTAGAMGTGIISYDLAQTALKDTLALTPSSVTIPLLRKEFAVTRQMLESFESEGIDFAGLNMREAVYQLAKMEEPYLVHGFAPDGTNYTTATGGFASLYQGAGLSESNSYDFGTYGNATLKMKLCRAQMAGSSYNITNQNYNLILHPDQYYELMVSRHTYSGEREVETVLQLLNPNTSQPQGRVIMSTQMTAAYGLLSPVDTTGQFIDLLVLKEASSVFWEDGNYPAPYNGVNGMVIEAIRPRIINSYGLTKISSI